MWMIFGLGAIIMAVLNLVWWTKSKKSEVFRFASISLTALTVCTLYSMEAERVVTEDWSALMDVMPTMSGMLWGLVVISVLINGITLIKSR